MYRWGRWGDENKAKSWLGAQIKIDSAVLKILCAFVHSVTSYGAGDYLMKVSKKIRLADFENFIPISSIQAELDKLDLNKIDDSSKEVVDAFNKAVELREKGIEYDW